MANNILLASDNFASGSLAAGWSAWFGELKCQVVSGTPNVTEPNTALIEAGQIWTGLTWPNDHISELTIKTFTAESNIQILLGCRMQSGSLSGYGAAFQNGAAQIYRIDSGSYTQLGSGVTGLTIASGDVWSFEAAGSVLSLYQNGNRVLYEADTTYTGGSPGYTQSTANLTHNQVSSWRGYNAVQQDGIWKKQGIVLAPNATDLTGGGGLGEGVCIYDDNPQILAGPNVYKLWFNGGAVGSQGTFYAESPDLVNWTRHSGAVVSGYVIGGVIKNGSTYYLYAQSQAAQGSGDTYLYTSTDGITWTQIGDVFATGHYPLKPIAIISGTWYALYGIAGGAGAFSVYLATSTDGAGAVWSASASNPVIAAHSTYPFACFAKIGSTYYVWMQQGPSSPQNSAPANAFDPNECVRYSTTDFIHWSAPVVSLHHSQMHEALNTPVNNTEPVGGTAPIAIFDISGVAHMLYALSQGDNIGPGNGQYSLAIAPATIANIVQEQEDAVQQIATDSFTSGIGPLSSNWKTIPGEGGALQIVAGNLCEAATTSGGAAAFTGASFSVSQYSEVTIATFSSGFIAPVVLTNLSTGAFYYFGLSGIAGTLTNASLMYFDGSVNHNLGPTVGITPQLGDVLRLSAIQTPSGVVLSFFQNGSLIAQVVDETYKVASGSPGMVLSPSGPINHLQISKWSGGNANVMPFGIISGNAGVAGAMVCYSGATSGCVTADGSGNYTFPSLANGAYTITPSLAGYTFSPTSASETISNGNITGVNFTATNTPLATPTFAISDGATNLTQQVTITVDGNATATYYTTDGSTPTISSTLYSGPFNITTAETIKALSVGSPYANSAVGTVTYAQQATPTFNPVAGSYTSTQSVSITSASATEVYYEVGSSPYPGHETLYTVMVSVAVSETLYARAARTGDVNSVIGSAVYVIGAATNPSNNLLLTTNALQTPNGLLSTNLLLRQNLLGGTSDWS